MLKAKADTKSKSAFQNYWLACLAIIGLLAAAIAYRYVTLQDIDENLSKAEAYNELAEGKTMEELASDEKVNAVILKQSLEKRDRPPSPEEAYDSLREIEGLADAGPEIISQRAKFQEFIDLVIYILLGLFTLSLVIFLLKSIREYRMTSHR